MGYILSAIYLLLSELGLLKCLLTKLCEDSAVLIYLEEEERREEKEGRSRYLKTVWPLPWPSALNLALESMISRLR